MTQDDVINDVIMDCPVCKGRGNDLSAETKYEKATGTNARFPCTYCGGEGKIRMISLTRAQELLGKNTVICVEPDGMMARKISDDKASELWGFNVYNAISGRGDRKYFDVRPIDRGGWYQLAIYEEPEIEAEEDEIRIVGQIIIEYCRGIIVVREADGLNGPIFELKASSISKDQLAPEDSEPVAYFETNPQRIMGLVAVHLVKLPNLPEISDGEIYMAWEEFCKITNDGRQDGRSLAAASIGSIYKK